MVELMRSGWTSSGISFNLSEPWILAALSHKLLNYGVIFNCFQEKIIIIIMGLSSCQRSPSTQILSPLTWTTVMPALHLQHAGSDSSVSFVCHLTQLQLLQCKKVEESGRQGFLILFCFLCKGVSIAKQMTACVYTNAGFCSTNLSILLDIAS